MVHQKRKSGDPDFDDKVPLEQQIGETVKGPDGEDVLVTEAAGPVKADGSHANLDGPTAEDLDNRPAPGGVATEASEVQTAAPVKAARSKDRSETATRKP